MKTVELSIDLDNINKDDVNSTTYDISISEFDPSSACLETMDDLDEKVINYIEREVRSSYEYRKYINYLKTELDLTKCSMLDGIDTKDLDVSLEFHHYPMNLYEIVETIATKNIQTLCDDEKASCFDIAEQVMEEHFRGNIGLVPLTKTLHDMAHNRSIIIPITKVEGNYKNFIKRYSSYIPDDIKDRITETELNSMNEDVQIFNSAKLEKNITNFNIKYTRNGGNDETE